MIAATNIPEVNHLVYRLAEERSILCNAVDDPDYCHFYYGAVVRRGPLQIAISTDGLSPALAQRLRRELEQQFGPEYEAWLEYLGAMRDLIRASTSDDQRVRSSCTNSAKPEAFADFVSSQDMSPSEGAANGQGLPRWQWSWRSRIAYRESGAHSEHRQRRSARFTRKC